MALRSRALTSAVRAGRDAIGSRVRRAVRDRIAAWGKRLAVAAVNGPAATVVSGDPGALADLVAACGAEGVQARAVPVDYASHGVQVEAIREEIAAALAPITPGRRGSRWSRR